MKQVDVPSVQGSFGILPKHVPAIATLKPGVLTVFEESDIKKFFGVSLTIIDYVVVLSPTKMQNLLGGSPFTT